jgi:hypothetical protein
MSYHNSEKAIAAAIAKELNTVAVESFMAHEDIDVSQEWREALLGELDHSHFFIPVLSEAYLTSPWCLQESGIAAYKKLTIIPLSIDGTTPPGFISYFQSTRIDPKKPELKSLLPGLAKHDITFTLDTLIQRFGKSGGYRTAEANFETLEPYLARATDEQMATLLTLSAQNSQIYDAGGIHAPLTPLIRKYGHLLNPDDLLTLKVEFKKYNVTI